MMCLKVSYAESKVDEKAHVDAHKLEPSMVIGMTHTKDTMAMRELQRGSHK